MCNILKDFVLSISHLFDCTLHEQYEVEVEELMGGEVEGGVKVRGRCHTYDMIDTIPILRFLSLTHTLTPYIFLILTNPMCTGCSSQGRC